MKNWSMDFDWPRVLNLGLMSVFCIALIGVLFLLIYRTRVSYFKIRKDKLLQKKHTADAILSAILVNSSDMIYVKDRKSRLLYANPATLEAIGRTEAMVLGKNDLEFLGDIEAANKIIENDQLIFSSGRTQIMEETVCYGARPHVYQSRKAPYRDESGNIIGLIGVSRDITVQREFEESLIRARKSAELASQLKIDFLTNMSHEIRTPLNSILGNAEYLTESGVPTPEQTHSLQALRRNALQLADLLNDVLDLSKVEVGQLEIELVSCNIKDLVRYLHSSVGETARKKGIAFAIHADGVVPEKIRTDPARLRQILGNVIGNAIKFTDQGSVDVSISLKKSLRRGSHSLLQFCIQDTGIGICAGDLAHLFAPFTQSDNSMTRRFGGTGLGLVLARKLAYALGGDVILVESTPGLGSKFLVTVDCGAPERKKLERPNLSNTDRCQGLNILVADDSPDNLDLVELMLKPIGAHVITAENGIEVVNLALSSEVDLVLMDIQMPGQDGLTATRVLRSNGFKKPIIAITANAMKQDRETSIQAGCNEHITKPIQKDLLINLIARSTKEDRDSTSRNAFITRW